MDALEAVYHGTRAPLQIGTHFNDWMDGKYMQALRDFIEIAHEKYPDVQFVTFEQLAVWLDAQDPKVLKELQSRPVQTYQARKKGDYGNYID